MSLERLIGRINEFADINLRHKALPARSDKVIHECIWGTHEYDKNQISLLDTPLIQRLRQIHQTGLAYFTFPTAVHTRFDHTLGTFQCCWKLTDVLKKKSSKLINEYIEPLRIAAILHDCGHGIFSHTSEEIYILMDEIQKARSPGSAYEYVSKPHELLSCLIVKSDAFKKFLKQIYSDCDPDQIANFIIGVGDGNKKYAAEVLSSIYDCDKIDYIHRDAHFSGLPLKIDLDRLWYGINIRDVLIDGKKYQKLVVSHAATEPLEQMIFHKTMLYPTFYHHQKVRACDCMFKGIIEYIRRKNLKIQIGKKQLGFDKPEDFLLSTDDEFIVGCLYHEDIVLNRLVNSIRHRNLLQRVLAISHRNILGFSEYSRLISLRDNSLAAYTELGRIRQLIYEEAKKKKLEVLPEEIWIDLPSEIKVTGKDVEEAYVAIRDDSNRSYKSGFIQAREIFPVNDWARQIDLHKWQGFVFGPQGMQEKLAPIVKEVLENEYKFKIKPSAFIDCHVKPPI